MSSLPAIGAILIGDELLTGRRQDKHMATLIGQLAERGLALSWVEIVGDDQNRLVGTLKRSLASDDVVFSYGGIGATPDDCTRQSAAAALSVPIERHPEGVAILERNYGDAAYPSRVQMVEFPQGARLIPNPVNEVPGFSIKQHHFVPGFPGMATPMVQWVLDHEYPDLHAEKPRLYTLIVRDQPESRFIQPMLDLGAAFPNVKVSSLPNAQTAEHFIEFGFYGVQVLAEQAREQFCSVLQAWQVPYELVIDNVE